MSSFRIKLRAGVLIVLATMLVGFCDGSVRFLIRPVGLGVDLALNVVAIVIIYRIIAWQVRAADRQLARLA